MRMLTLTIPALFLFDLQVFATKDSAQPSSHAGPATGPCTLGTHSGSGALRCTENGYFELVQCHMDYCVCVDPRTGDETTVTRTGSNKVTPQCGNCHLDVARRVAAKHWETGSDIRMPQCNPDNGKYKRVQCHDSANCFCVDETSGVPMRSGGGVVLEIMPLAQLNCNSDPLEKSSATVGRFAASVDPTAAAVGSRDSFVLANRPSSLKSDGGAEKPAPFELSDAPVADPICRLPKHVGKPCDDAGRRDPAPSVQWHFDMETFECLAFRHNGCGGNANRFPTISECWRRCKLADFGGCSGLKRPATDTKGDNIICFNNGLESQSCPSGYRCTMLAFFGVCCHTETQELYKRNYSPSCEPVGNTAGSRNPKRPVKINASTSGGVPAVLLGKACEDGFCPSGSTCHKQEIFAHCCS